LTQTSHEAGRTYAEGLERMARKYRVAQFAN